MNFPKLSFIQTHDNSLEGHYTLINIFLEHFAKVVTGTLKNEFLKRSGKL